MEDYRRIRKAIGYRKAEDRERSCRTCHNRKVKSTSLKNGRVYAYALPVHKCTHIGITGTRLSNVAFSFTCDRWEQRSFCDDITTSINNVE